MKATAVPSKDGPAGDGAAMVDRARAIAVQALKGLHERGLPPTPENYAVLFTHASGGNAALSAELDRLKASGQPLTTETLSGLHDRFLGAASERAGLQAVSARVEETVRSLIDRIGAAEAGAARYGRTLTDFSGELAGDGLTGESLRAVVGAMIGETERMVALNRQLEQRLSNSAQEIGQLRADLDAVREEANTDPLTALPNRRSFDRELEAAAAATPPGMLSLLALDIDHFKRFNDTHGHQTGDHVLKLVARSMASTVGKNGFPARLGGEEFAVLLRNTDLRTAREVAEAVRIAVGTKTLRNRRTAETLGNITLSVGVAVYQTGEPLADFIARADEALYLAKRCGRNQVRTEAEVTSVIIEPAPR